MNYELIKELLISSLSDLHRCDYYLVENNVSERAIAHKLAEHLQNNIPSEYGLHIDCEYNRHLNFLTGKVETKTTNYNRAEMEEFYEDLLERYKEKIADLKVGDDLSLSIFPDIIIHSRGNNDKNRLVIELKKYSNTDANDRNYDITKLQKLTSDRCPYQYDYGAFIDINKCLDETLNSLIWFKNGTTTP